MGVLGQIFSMLVRTIDSLVDAAVLRPPVGLLVITLAILAASVLPERKREKAKLAAVVAAGLIVMLRILEPTS
jgi:hypothetical protein